MKNWAVKVLTDNLAHKTYTQPACTDTVSNYLNRNFPFGDYYSVYEAGISGFLIYYKLREMGINNIVINLADVPITQKEHLQKDDLTDSRKLARSLRTGDLMAIYIPEPSTLEDRSQIQLQSTLVKDMVRFKQRIKSFLHFYVISVSAELEKAWTPWSKRFMKWLNQGVSLQHKFGTQTLRVLLHEAEQQRKLLLEVLRKIWFLSCRKSTNIELLTQ